MRQRSVQFLQLIFKALLLEERMFYSKGSHSKFFYGVLFIVLHSAGAVPLPLITGMSTVAMSNVVLPPPPQRICTCTIMCIAYMH